MKTALFVDFDNVFSGLRRISAKGAERFARHPARWLRWLTDDLQQSATGVTPGATRRVLVRRCYMNPVMYQQFRRPFHEAGFEIVDCPPMTATGKTSTDIHLVLDTMDALQDQTHFDEFVVFSADADFSPLLRRLRRHDRRTAVFAAGAMSESYKASADVVIDIPTFIREGLELAEAEDDDDAAVSDLPAPDQRLRSQAIQVSCRVVRGSEGPVPLPSLASALQRQVPGLRQSQWAGAGSFGALMRQLELPEVSIDFHRDTAYDLTRKKVVEKKPGVDVRPADPIPAQPNAQNAETLSPDQLDHQAASLVRRLVGEAFSPLHLSVIGQCLRREFPQLVAGWNGAPTLAAFLQRLRLEPLQRAALDDGSTMVLYEPGRHAFDAAPAVDPAVAAMLRAAELPAMKAADLVLVLDRARPYMGTGEPFEITAVSRCVHRALSASGQTVSGRRIGAVLQALIFGGLDTAAKFAGPDDLAAAAVGVILAAWSRETQAPVDNEARSRILGWLQSPREGDGSVAP